MNFIWSDPRVEAAETLDNVKNSTIGVMKELAALGRVSSAMYTKLLKARREQFVDAVDASRTAKAMVKF